MNRAKVPGRVATALIALVLTAFIASMTWAALDDYLLRDNLPAGATVAGVSVGNLTPAQATSVIEQRVTGPMLQPISVTFRGTPTTVEPVDFVAVDVEAILADAAAPKLAAALHERVWWRVTSTAYGEDTTEIVSVDAAKVQTWVEQEKQRLTIPAADATISVKGSKLNIKSAKPGVSFDATAAVAALSDALVAGTKTVALTETSVAPRIPDSKLGKTIFVSTSKKTLTLYNGTKIEKKYDCAVGMPGYPTPLGTFNIEQKRYRPSWSNPGSAWAAGMPDYIPPGPGNPLGTRALNISSPGIRIHGTNKNYSIGTAASHGCMRMHMWDIEDLYPRVKVGTRVIIVR
jgi:lipoprotein-anchoring transpeptidase ErfK/SrfK